MKAQRARRERARQDRLDALEAERQEVNVGASLCSPLRLHMLLPFSALHPVLHKKNHDASA